MMFTGPQRDRLLRLVGDEWQRLDTIRHDLDWTLPTAQLQADILVAAQDVCDDIAGILYGLYGEGGR